MKASELIERLQKEMAAHGDLEVYTEDDDATALVLIVETLEPGRDLVARTASAEIEELPKRFFIS